MSLQLPIQPDAVAGLVLAGGLSSRFGTNKALARFDQRSLLQLGLERFAPCPARAVAVRRQDPVTDHARQLGVRVLFDAADAPAGPLAGVAAGLAWASGIGCAFLAIAPCDAPMLRWAHYERLLREIGGAPAAFAVSAAGEHPLCAVWRCDLFSTLENALRDGRHPAVRGFLRNSGARSIMFEDGASFANANTPAELAELTASRAP